MHMATLKLKSITCLDTAETGVDELYVTFNGTSDRTQHDSRSNKNPE